MIALSTRLNKLACLLALLLAVGCGDEENIMEEVGDADMHHGDAADAGETGDSGPTEEDAGPDADADEEECDNNGSDSDGDGLSDCREEELGTDPDDADTDGDGLSDGEEVQRGTDPLKADTDGDGLDDAEEYELGLDPLAADSYGDGTLDSERWFVSLCDDEGSAALDFYEDDGPGNWRVALAPGFDNYTALTISGADATNQQAAAVFSDATLEVAGSIFSAPKDAAVSSPSAVQQNHSQDISSVGAIQQSRIGGEFDTHDFHRASTAHYEISVQTPTSAEQLRDEILFATAPFAQADVSDLPAASGDESSDFRVSVGVVIRASDSGDDQTITLLSVAPLDRVEAEYAVEFATGDLTNTTQLAEAGAGNGTDCQVNERPRPPQVDYYWVLDHTDSMSAHAATARAAAEAIFDNAEALDFDARFAATSMKQNNKGKLDPAVGWQRDRQTFVDHVEALTGSGGEEPYGLYAAREGIGYMKGIYGSASEDEKSRPNAQIVTIFVTDKEAHSFVDHDLDSSSGQTLLGSFENFFSSHTRSYALLGNGEDCGVAEGASYELIAIDNGGQTGSLCDDDVETIFDSWINTGQPRGASIQLPDTPISSSIRTFANGGELTRDRDNGFDYSPSNNTVNFFGDARPEADGDEPNPDMAVVIYETYVDSN